MRYRLSYEIIRLAEDAASSEIDSPSTSMYNNVQISKLSGGGVGMKVVSFTEFRKNASEVLNIVEKGATVRITRHGKTIAKIIPENSDKSEPAWKRAGLRLIVNGASLSNAILDERRSSR
jgi:prevent-host-death family protein